MLLLSSILKRIVYPALSHVGYFRNRRARQISIIAYHGVLPPGYTVRDQFLDAALLTAESFRQQLKLLKSEYNVLDPEEFLRWWATDLNLFEQEPPENAALITCVVTINSVTKRMMTDVNGMAHQGIERSARK